MAKSAALVAILLFGCVYGRHVHLRSVKGYPGQEQIGQFTSLFGGANPGNLTGNFPIPGAEQALGTINSFTGQSSGGSAAQPEAAASSSSAVRAGFPGQEQIGQFTSLFGGANPGNLTGNFPIPGAEQALGTINSFTGQSSGGSAAQPEAAASSSSAVRAGFPGQEQIGQFTSLFGGANNLTGNFPIPGAEQALGTINSFTGGTGGSSTGEAAAES